MILGRSSAWLKAGKTLTEQLGKARLASRDITEMIGVCKGVLADGVVNLQEANFILSWLEDHRDITNIWPADVLYEATDRILEDGELSPDEEGELVGLLAEITGTPVRVNLSIVSESGEVVDQVERGLTTSSTLPLHEPPGDLEFDGRNFVLTGNFLYGPRRECEAAVAQRGGVPQKGVTKKTNYLVIGEVGSEAWAHSAFGRKIEKAVYMREQGHEIFIVHESTWRASIG